MTSEDEGFFSRWSRRKTQRRAGQTLTAPLPPAVPQTPAETNPLPAQTKPNPVPPQAKPAAVQPPSPAAAPADALACAAPELPAPTLADVALLTPTSDFSRFVASGVAPSVQHAALRKLFSDPHFNEMDGLDVYIGDYNTPNPISEKTRRRLLEFAARHTGSTADAGTDSAAMRSEREPATLAAAAPEAAAPLSAPLGASDPAPSQPGPETDEDTALRLQPDDAADAPSVGPDRPGARA